MRRSALAALSLFLAASSACYADVKLPAIFGDHMVLQRDAKVPVWGTADAGEKVTVTVGDAKATATAGDDGKWTVKVDSLKASDQPIDVTVAGKNTVTFHDVLVGDVWVCSGQSNMEFQLGGGKWGFGGDLRAAEEIPKANHPTLRLFIVQKKIAFTPEANCAGSWVLCTPETAPKFSAVGYFFGRDILEAEKVPVGLIGTYWGGTPAESWTTAEALAAHPETKALADRVPDQEKLEEAEKKYETVTLPAWKKAHEQWQTNVGEAYAAELKKWNAEVAKATAAGEKPPAKPTPSQPEPRQPASPKNDPHMPTVLYNGMIAPIVHYGIKGAIWYQGESNAGQAVQYRTLFPTMITDWRTRWDEGDFPFIWVQLAAFDPRWKAGEAPTQTADGWAGLREAQDMTLKLPNTGQAITTDIGNAADIHPKDKVDVGYRLALAARHVAYGEDLVYSGPTYDSMSVDGDKIRIKFKNVGGGLIVSAPPTTQPAAEAGGELKGFSIAGEDHKFVWATASIDGDSLVVSSPDVKEPKAVRYDWDAFPLGNLYNKEHLPASPFRTDDWGNPAPPEKAKK